MKSQETKAKIEILQLEKKYWKYEQFKANAMRNVCGYDVNNEYGWSTSNVRSVSLKLYHLNK